MICIVAREGEEGAVPEAQLRIRGELASSGLDVVSAPPEREGEPPCATATARLQLSRDGRLLTITASTAGHDVTLVQTVALDHPATTAELIAIRAVEGLRAALIQAIRRPELGERLDSPAIRAFTQQAHQQPEPAAPPKAKPDDAQGEPAQPATSTPVEPKDAERPTAQQTSVAARGRALLALGPAVLGDTGIAPSGIGADVSAHYVVPGLALGAYFMAPLASSTWTTAGYQLSVLQYSALFGAALRLPCRAPLECQLGFLGGFRQVSMRAMDGLQDRSVTHTSALLLGRAFLGYSFTSVWGVGLDARVGSLVNPPVMTVKLPDGTPIGESRWGLPSYSAGLLLTALL